MTKSSDNISSGDYVMFGQMEKHEYAKIRKFNEVIQPEVIELCKLLQIPAYSEHHLIIARYREVLELWEPQKYMHDPDKYFNAQQVTEQFKRAYDLAKHALCVDALSSDTDALNINLGSLSSDNELHKAKPSICAEPAINNISNNSDIQGLWLKIQSVVIILLLIAIAYYWFGGQQLGSQMYKGNINSFVNDSRQRAESISTLISILLPCVGVWVVLFFARLFR